jgi:hypothetical protein
MTAGGLERTDGRDKRHNNNRYNNSYNSNNEEDNGDDNARFKNKSEAYRYKQIEDSLLRKSKDRLRSIDEDKRYRYQEITDSIKLKAKEKLREEMRVKDSIERERKLKEVIKTSSTRINPIHIHTGDASSLMLSPVVIFAS